MNENTALEAIEEPIQIPEGYRIAYTINDPIIGEPFHVKLAKTGRIGWWSDSVKVGKLIGAFQLRATVTQACISAGISKQQYLDFCTAHPEFQGIKERCKEVFGLQAKMTYAQGLKKDHWLAAEYLKNTEAETFANKTPMLPPPDGGGVLTLMEQSFVDADGKIVMTRKAAEYLEQHNDGPKS